MLENQFQHVSWLTRPKAPLFLLCLLSSSQQSIYMYSINSMNPESTRWDVLQRVLWFSFNTAAGEISGHWPAGDNVTCPRGYQSTLLDVWVLERMLYWTMLNQDGKKKKKNHTCKNDPHLWLSAALVAEYLSTQTHKPRQSADQVMLVHQTV